MSSSLRKRIERLESTGGQDGAAMVEALGHAFECMRCDYGRTPRPPAPKVLRDMARMPPRKRLKRAREIWPGYTPGGDVVKPMVAYDLEHLLETGELVHKRFCYDPSVEPILPDGEG